ncbi:hypothetical protein ACPZ19_50260 [Amycolatopsis lurida]
MTGLRLREEFYYTRTARGVYALTHRGPLVLTGSSVFALLDKVAPYLDGTHTEEELTASLSAEKATSVRALLGVLRNQGALLTGQVPDHAGFAGEIRMIGEFRPAAEQVFRQYRDRTVGVLGDGPLEEFVRAAHRSGSRKVVVADRDADIVYQLSDVDRAGRWSPPPGAHHTPVVLTAKEAWVGAGSGRRLAGWGQPGPAAHLAGPRARLLAGRVVHHTFRAITGIENNPGRVLRLDLDTWNGRSVPLLPHPFDAPCAADSREEFAERIAALSSGPEVTEEEFDRSVTRCIDDGAGLFGPPADRGVQLPLHVTEMRVADPRGPVTVTGTGLSNAEARRAAAMTAFAVYGSLMVDARRLVRPDGSPPDLPGDPDEALAAARGSDLAAWGIDLASGAGVTAAVDTAFPAVPPEGASAGYTWRQAIERGLVARCRSLVLGTITAPPEPFLPVGADRERKLLARLAAVGEPVRLEDVTGWPGVPTFQCVLGERVSGCASALSADEARVAALHAALRAYQGIAPPPSGRLRGTGEARDTTVEEVVDRLAGAGLSAVAVPLDHDPEASKVMPYVANVVLNHG